MVRELVGVVLHLQNTVNGGEYGRNAQASAIVGMTGVAAVSH